jgi:7-keto-8-aminopelargonate synthetase-like enzyme
VTPGSIFRNLKVGSTMADGSVGEAVRGSMARRESLGDYYRERYYEGSRHLSEARVRVRALERRLAFLGGALEALLLGGGVAAAISVGAAFLGG